MHSEQARPSCLPLLMQLLCLPGSPAACFCCDSQQAQSSCARLQKLAAGHTKSREPWQLSHRLQVQKLTVGALLQRNAKALKGLYHKALDVKSAIPHPRILGVIRECGGKMHMHQRTWAEAATDFFEVPRALMLQLEWRMCLA